MLSTREYNVGGIGAAGKAYTVSNKNSVKASRDMRGVMKRISLKKITVPSQTELQNSAKRKFDIVSQTSSPRSMLIII